MYFYMSVEKYFYMSQAKAQVKAHNVYCKREIY